MPAILSKNLDMGAFFMREKIRRYYIFLLTLILAIMGRYGHFLQSEETFLAQKESFSTRLQSTNEKRKRKNDTQKVYASGVPIGIYVKTEGILVLGLQQVEGKNGKIISPASCKIKAGDYILELNGQKITGKQQFIRLLQKNGAQEAVLTIKRKSKRLKVKVQPVYSAKNACYQIGVWIRNDTQGIGTVTFIKKDGTFAALGHGISDGDIGVQFSIEGGSAYKTNISSILKGKSGVPGEIIGTINYMPENYLGEIYLNTSGGIFGKIIRNKTEFFTGEMLPIAKKSEVRTGKAYLRSSINGESKEYSIEIEKVFFHEKNSLKTLKIKVTDPALISLTGGIIQGLSGSPILQNGKLVGAVTHVLIDNPQKGYGIFAENMLE